MRGEWPRRGCPTLLTLVLVCLGACIGTTGVEGASDILLEDDFEQLQSNLDPSKWIEQLSHSSGSIQVSDGMLLVDASGCVWAAAETVEDLVAPYFRVEVGWMHQGDDGHPLEIELITRDDGMWETELIFAYGGPRDGWGFITDRNRPDAKVFTGIANATQDYWYDIVITVELNFLSVSVTNVTSGAVAFEGEVPISLRSNTRVRIGAMTPLATSEAVAAFDEFRIIDLRPPSLRPIEATQPPIQMVTERVPFIFDYSPYVHDPDGDIDDLYLFHINDPHVTAIDGLEVSFLFDEDGGEVEVPLTLTDGLRFTHMSIVFQVEDVNDPPRIQLRSPYTGDIYEVFDSVEVIFDVVDADDNDWIVEVTSDKDGEMQAPYRWGWRYEVHYFPFEGGTHILTINVSDGEYQAQEQVAVYIEPLPDSTLGSSSFEDFSCILGCIVIFIVLSLAGLAIWTTRKAQKKIEVKPQDDVWARRMWESERTGSVPRAGGQQTTPAPPTQPPIPSRPHMSAPPGYRGDEMVDDGTVDILFEPPEDVTPSPLVTVPEEEWRVRSTEEFETLLQELPEGLPEPLWGIPWWTLGNEVMASSMTRADGTVVCVVGGKAFHADKRDLDTFMQEVED